MNLGIVGSRRRNSEADFKIVDDVVRFLHPECIISGGCKEGADRFAEQIAKKHNYLIRIFRPLLKKTQTKSEVVKLYHARNRLIAQNCDVLLALVAKDRKGGTESTIRFAKQFGKEVILK